MGRISAKAVVVGGILDIVLTNVMALPVMLYAGVNTGAFGLPEAESTQMLLAAFRDSPGLNATAMLLGSLCSIIGGYVAARIAKREAVLHGALSAFLCVASSIYGMVVGPDTLPMGVHLAFLPLSPVLGALGGRLWERRAAVPPEPPIQPLTAS